MKVMPYVDILFGNETVRQNEMPGVFSYRRSARCPQMICPLRLIIIVPSFVALISLLLNIGSALTLIVRNNARMDVF